MRSKKALYNVIANSIVHVLQIVLSLVVRKTFLVTLGADVLGLNSFFNSVLSMLSLTELGIGVSVATCLYKPLAEEDYEKVNAYMALLKKVYYVISLIIFVVGILLIPLLPYLTESGCDNDFIIKAFVLYLFATAITYLFSYKKTLLSADQRNYVINLIQIGYKLLINGGYLIALIVFKNYYVFLLVMIICNFAESFIAAKVCDRYCPYLNANASSLTKDETKVLVEKIKGMLCFRISNYLITGTDNIILSALIGTVVVTYYSNYYLVINMMYAICACIGTSSVAGFGNIFAVDKKSADSAVARLLLIQHFVFSATTIAFVCTGTEFIGGFFGEESVFSLPIIVAMAVIYYVQGYSQGIEAVRCSKGMYERDKWINLAIAVVNVVVSCVLVKPLGVLGVLIGTLISYVLRYVIVLPEIVCRHILEKSLWWYWGTMGKSVLITMGTGIIAYTLCENIGWSNWVLNFVAKGTLAVTLSVVVNIILFARNSEFKNLVKMVKVMLKREQREQ